MVYQNGKAVAMLLASSAGESQDIYSTEEQVIGRWIDGKPLYRMVLVTNTGPSDGQARILLPSDSVKQIVMYSAYVGGDAYCQQLPAKASSGDLDDGIGIWCDTAVGVRIINTRAAWANTEVIVILQYTKTTDSVSASSDKTMSVSLPEAVSASASSAKVI